MNSSNISIKKLYYSIGEVSKITGIKPYVLRYWQTEFKQLNPPKNRAGNRTYRQKDIDNILRIKTLLYERKFTIDGARKQLDSESDALPGRSTQEATQSFTLSPEVLHKIRDDLMEILSLIRK